MNNNNTNNNIGTVNETAVFNAQGSYGRAAQKLLKQAVVEPWPEPVDAVALLDELSGNMSRFVVLPQHAADALALWVVHTYGFELRDVTSYLGVESPEKRCGKSTLLTLLSRLVNRPVVASNISAPAFFRVIEQTRPTLIIDEADTFLRKNDELRGILNAGYYKDTGYVVRVANEKLQNPTPKHQRSSNSQASIDEESEREDSAVGGLRHYSCWCPKALAAIGRLPETLADRCIVIRMERKRRQEVCERLKKLTEGQALVLRRKCARLVMDHAETIATREPDVPEALNDRAADIWEPLLVIATLAGEKWVERAHRAATSLCVTAQERSPVGALLLDLMLMFMSHQERKKFFTKEVLSWLDSLEERPWWQLKRGQELTDMWLAQRLRPYGIMPRTIWIEGQQGKGYTWEQCDEVFKRYIPRAEWEAKKAEIRESQEQRRKAAEEKAELERAKAGAVNRVEQQPVSSPARGEATVTE